MWSSIHGKSLGGACCTTMEISEMSSMTGSVHLRASWHTSGRSSRHLGKPAARENHGRFILMLSAFGSLGGVASGISRFRRCEAWFHRTLQRSKRAPEGRERPMARGVKSNFRAPCIVLVKHMSSVCALTEDVCRDVTFDKRHPVLASIQYHSNTTISLAMLNPTLTIQHCLPGFCNSRT